MIASRSSQSILRDLLLSRSAGTDHAPCRHSVYAAFAGWLLLNSTLAYCQNLLNFLVTKYTSALTLQVLGNAKGVVAAAVSVLIFRNPVTLMGCTGYFVTMLGVVAYSESKKRSKWAEEARHKRTSSELPVTENDAQNGSPGSSSARV